ncbi:DUF3330 domain-containing protein [Thiohalophilus sp.]|uniref:DUF3330 domain-containing protein n=1 Tax=Thiohalophilus sp. TaxID=3028392 RepID=UPI0039760460
MSDTPDKSEKSARLPETVKCAVCRREIPRVDAITEEGGEYMRWYCGFDCYQSRKQDSEPASRQ